LRIAGDGNEGRDLDVVGAGLREVWAASLTGGLFRLEPDGKWRRFGVEHGLPSNSIRTLLAEDDGTLWLSTGVETVRFDPETGAARSFGPADGMPSFVHTKSSFRSSSGELFFGGLDGFVAFEPDAVRLDELPPEVVLTDFRIGRATISPRARQPDSPLDASITLAEGVTLRHAQNDFSIELAALHFGDPARNCFAYRLDGVDSDWVETSAERSFARYSRIPSGRHLFRAKAANRDGVWSRDEARLKIHILPPWWRSWWALTLYASVAALLLFAWIRTQLSRLRRATESQEKELKVLRGMLPICASCKKIRDDKGEWEPLESYLDSHSEAELTHGICPQCTTQFLADLPDKEAADQL
ncbi:MAG: triple tyrosine motif-containing protein, partial [Acidobacteriota bacterium]